MKSHLPSACLLLVATGLLAAEVPRKPLISKYSDLWTDSPFTTKPVGSGGAAYNTLQDYVLLGVAPIKDGYRVTMINRKRSNDERVVVETQRPHDGIEIQEVIYSKGKPMGTQVRIARNGATAIIGFEDKFLVLKPPVPVEQPNPKDPNRPVATQQGEGNNAPPPLRAERRRIVPADPNNSQNRTR